VREPAELCRSAPDPACPGIAAAVDELPWLAPGVSSLVALCRPITSSTWNVIRTDPGALLLLLRSIPDTPPQRLPELLHEPALLESALRHLDEPVFIDWKGVVAGGIYQFAIEAAANAAHLASATGRADPETARVCALVAPLGWMAVCALNPAVADGCVADPVHPAEPAETQRRWWGLDQAAIARRLQRRWRLPGWLASGRLNMPAELAADFGADPGLFHVTRVAVGLAAQRGIDPGIVNVASFADSARALGIPTTASKSGPVQPASCPREDPKAQPLLRDLLQVALESRRAGVGLRYDRLQDEADLLQDALEGAITSQARRLQEEKLTALAEFAAGAGHEINNPLAVILGQAQYLLGHEADWFTPDLEGEAKVALQKIVTQTRRIHGLLRDLMQFARPAPPVPAWHDLPALLLEVTATLAELASDRQVTVSPDVQPERLSVFVDANQTKTALTCLLRNAIEASPAGGMVRIVVRDRSHSDSLRIAIEDSGPGPDPAIRESLFDPFFSGRSAGRGRGLGLPTAWRLARQQGGDVHLDARKPGEPTRFVLTLPRVDPTNGVENTIPLTESFLAAPLAPSAGPASNGCRSA
jgi:signal transduction histidine kinase